MEIWNQNQFYIQTLLRCSSRLLTGKQGTSRRQRRSGWATGARLRKNRAAADCLERRGDSTEPDRSTEWRARGGEGRLLATGARLDSVGDGRGREGGSAGGSGHESRAMEDRATQRISTERLLPYFSGLHVLGYFMSQN